MAIWAAARRGGLAVGNGDLGCCPPRRRLRSRRLFREEPAPPNRDSLETFSH